jgi:Cys-tRNA synthase (O-phospho-L-seryl-tRNA:Cys-tRNA synthase)
MVLEILGWAVTAAAAAWGLTLSWAKAALAMSRDAMQEQVDRWKAEAMRAHQMVDQLRTEAVVWSRGRQAGREDLIAMMPLLVAAQNDLAGAQRRDETKTDR